MRNHRGSCGEHRHDAGGDEPERLRGEAVRRHHREAASRDRVRRLRGRRRIRVPPDDHETAVVRRRDRFEARRGRPVPRRVSGFDPREGHPRDAEMGKSEAGLGEKIGSGSSHAPETIKFLETWIREKGTLPPHARASWDTAKRLLSAAATRKLEEFGGGKPWGA